MFDYVTKGAAIAALATLTAVFPAFAAPSGEVHAIGVYQGNRGAAFEEAQLKLREEYITRTEDVLKSFPDGDAKGSELHALFVRQNDELAALQARYPATVTVRVTRTGTPLTLVLTAYEDVRWRVISETGVSIQRIIFSGYGKQELDGYSPTTSGRRLAKRGKRPKRKSDGARANRPEMNTSSPTRTNSRSPVHVAPFFFYEDDSEAKYEIRYDETKDTWVCGSQVDSNRPSTLLQSIDAIKAITGAEPVSMTGLYTGDEFEISNRSSGLDLRVADSTMDCGSDDIGKTLDAEGRPTNP